MKKPIIGIVTKHVDRDGSDMGLGPMTQSSDSIAHFVHNNGGIPMGIFPSDLGVNLRNDVFDPIKYKLTAKSKKRLIDVIGCCDGVVLQGGFVNDEYELFVAKYCFDNDIPILGICAGCQIMAHVLGGDIARHSESGHFLENYATHEIKISRGTKLFDIVGAEGHAVNSIHNYFVSGVSLATCAISAVGTDGNIEAFEAIDKKFYVGVQWHPELPPLCTCSTNIFAALVDSAKRRRR
ncbi:MAG: gamma-glutamyl-gamma-aminobutyrate hydrolase family protein [Firmicutes bacterium]|nr:gamma-glutamyl-gamma-aminobutyrate hydrolase family protein [Bacillota bacterium]